MGNTDGGSRSEAGRGGQPSSRKPPVAVPDEARVVVAGGGIIGLSVAFELARRQVQVLVLERDEVGASAAAVASAGMLAPVSEAEHEDPELLRLALDSVQRTPAFVESVREASGIDCPLGRDGTLLVALTQDDVQELFRLARFQERLGLHPAWLEAPAVREREPQLSPRVLGALHCPHDYQLEPRSLLAGLHRGVEALGGRVATRARVTAFTTREGRLSEVEGIQAADGGEQPFSVRCEAAVLACGAWSSTGLAWPAEPLGIRPVKGQVVRLKGPRLLGHVVRTPQVYLVPRAGGELVVGATVEERGFDAAVTAGAVMDLLWNAWRVLPALYDLEVAEVSVGFRPASRDHRPLVGPTGIPGLYVATGHFRHGILLAASTAALLADLIARGESSPLLQPFWPSRQVQGAPGHG